MSLGRGLESLIPMPEDGEGNAWQRAQDAAGEQPVEFLSDADGVVRQEAKEITSDEGKGLEGTVFQIEIENIDRNPHQPRRDFDEESLRELAASIREFGVLQPLIVSKIERETERGWSVRYELIAGERRLLAAKMAGLHTVPVIIREPSIEREKLELAIIENIQRADLNPIEFARAVSRLQDEFGLTQREIALRLGKSREAVANAVRLLSLPSEIQRAIEDGRVSPSHARLLLSVEDPAARGSLFKEILQESPTVREFASRIRRVRSGGPRQEAQSSRLDPEMDRVREELEAFLGTKVAVDHKGSSGRITIAYYSPEELDAIIEKLLGRRYGEETF